MTPFHCIVQRRPNSAASGAPFEHSGRSFATLAIDPLDVVPFPSSFEEVAERLAAFPRCYVEPDGSFSFAARVGEAAWRVEGCLFDRDGSLLYVELRGACPPDALGAIIAVLAEGEAPLVFQLPEQGVWLAADEFVRYACSVAFRSAKG